MPHPLETAADASFERLRAFAGRAEVVPGQPLVPGVWVAADTRDGRFEGAFAAEPDGAVRLDMRVPSPGRWLSLNMALDLAVLAPGTVLGLVAELAAEAPLQVGVTLRSGHDGGHLDIPSPDRLAAGSEPQVAVALLQVTAATTRPAPPAWRNLMLHLPQRDFGLQLRALRLFVHPPATPAETPAEAPAEGLAGA